mgnify:CR=1 FL=1
MISKYLSSEQVRVLEKWKRRAISTGGWSRWCQEHIDGHNKMLELLKRRRFFSGGTLTRVEIDELFGYTKWGQGGALVLCKEENPKRISKALRFLLMENKPLPDRFERFYRLKGAGIWTTSQILSKWRPRKYAFVAVGGKPFMEETLFDRLSSLQLETAEEDAIIEHKIDPAHYSQGTTRYLTLSNIVAEVKELLNLDYYWEVQNTLWNVWRLSQQRPRSAKLPKDRKKKRVAARVLSAEAVGESDARGMKIAMHFERNKGRKPDDTPSRLAVGYDIKSKSKTGAERYIEVKTRFGIFPVALTRNQYRVAKRYPNQYYVYVVTGNKEMYVVDDPARKCKIRPVPHVDYQLIDWHEKAKRVKVL